MAQRLHEILRDRRIALGWSQQTLANHMLKSQMAIWSWEHGKVDPRAGSLDQWANALGMKITAEVDPNWEPPRPPEDY